MFPNELGAPVGLLQSGGLSSLAVGIWLAEQSIETHHYIADIGQSISNDAIKLKESLIRLGLAVTVVDIRAQMADLAADLLRYRARHDGGYWNTTGASRYVLVNELAPILLHDECCTLAHGCVGGGNDQRRFDRYTAKVAPHLAVYRPWTDPAALDRFPDRTSMLKTVEELGLWLDPGSDARRSTDANIAGISHESADLEDLETPVRALDPRWSRWPDQAPSEPEAITVTFEHGAVIDVDGSGPEPLSWLQRGNAVGARQGIWLRDVVERRIIGTVCRGIYEAPGLELLDRAWCRILQAGLDADSRALYDMLSTMIGTAVYEARWLDPATVAARAAMDRLIEELSGRVTLRVHQGFVTVEAMSIASGVVRQTRFGSGGHRWSQVAEALSK